MKLYNSVGPNPAVVRMFAAEKGMSLPLVEVDLVAGENRQAAHLARNSAGQLPCLELDDGSFLSEVTAVCEYLEEVQPAPALIGRDAAERGETRMWTRRVDLNVCEPMGMGFRFGEGLRLFKDRIFTIPEASDGLKKLAQDRLGWLDEQLNGRAYLCGERFTLADILLFCFLRFGATVGQPLNPSFDNLQRWYADVAERPSASA